VQSELNIEFSTVKKLQTYFGWIRGLLLTISIYKFLSIKDQPSNSEFKVE